MIQRLCVIGLGLIGGSLALALQRARSCRQVVGCARRDATVQQAKALGIVQEAYTDPVRAVAGADMVVLAVPMGAMEPVMSALAPALDEDTVVTDVGSVKGAVVEAAERVFGAMPSRFVPGHPVAGTERSGVEAAFDSLFQGRHVILTPVQQTAPRALAKVTAMWEACGATVSRMTVAEHDRVLAATSHLPHMLAYALVDSLARRDDGPQMFRYAAGGFRDFTRIASSDPVMWRDICLTNRQALLRAMDAFSENLSTLRQAIESEDAQVLEAIFSSAKAARDRYVSQ